MTERVEKLLDFLKSDKGYIPCCGVYDTRNTVGDMMVNIYREDNISVDVCYGWDYIEVFGLSPEEFRDVEDFVYRENCRKRQSCDIEDFSDDEPEDEDDIVSVKGFSRWLDQICF